jgi:hypothetical protein
LLAGAAERAPPDEITLAGTQLCRRRSPGRRRAPRGWSIYVDGGAAGVLPSPEAIPAATSSVLLRLAAATWLFFQ